MILSTLMIAALLAAQPVPAAGAAATLVQPREVRLNLDGRNWACDPSGACVGRGGGARARSRRRRAGTRSRPRWFADRRGCSPTR